MEQQRLGDTSMCVYVLLLTEDKQRIVVKNGKDALDICRVVNGMWQTSGGWGRIDRDGAVDAMLRYADSGLTTFDMADIYGPAEDLYGIFINRVRHGRPPEFLEKVPPPVKMTRSFVSDSINVSRKRMDVDSLDMLQFHWWDYSNPGYLDALKHLTDLKDEGRIKTVALTNFNTERLQIILENDIPVVSNQVQHSIVDMRPQQRMAELCQLDRKSAESGSFKRSLLRPTSSKSPVLSASAFESRDGSDDDDNLGDCVKLDTTYLRTSGNVGPEGKNPYESLPDHVNANGEQMAIAASSMTRSHSVCGDLHGVQPKPIAADILRKESEQEVFARLKSLLLSPSPDEVEAYVVLQECLEMRKRYVFKEAIASWEKEIISNPDPFFYTPEGKSEMSSFHFYYFLDFHM
ncbi:hypothetical protein Ahy_A10g048970 isoform K [Arachis hypogaea]|uniref:NADP-dependent oxidoreductase domain-containing protein n=1 Tax=Arachis hypogaea TaxID=3818 RepID=A0A445B6D5_ARAHY|nr:hypothetical protein Ahy_A10g048970 isoform K [Arachis hypogaea]